MKTPIYSVRATMIRLALVLVTSVLLPLSAQAAKPESAGNSEAASQAKSAEAKKTEAEAKKSKDKAEKSDEAAKSEAESAGKQTEKKAGQERKELDKGSEKGREMREKKSRKWWKFWGGEKPAGEVPEKSEPV